MRRLLFAAALALAPAGAAWADHNHGHGQDHGGHDAAQDGMLAASTPADGAIVATAPRALALTFAHPVVLQTVAVTGPNGPVQASFRRPNAATLSYSIALPALGAGVYEARWTASGQGHAMSGVVRFTVQ
ncbi:MAG: copper resistance CopC family protein [Hyphomonadaceae bacterium]